MKEEPDPPHYSWWEILRDHWYIAVLVLAFNFASRLLGIPEWLGFVIGVAVYAAAVRAWRRWRRRGEPTEDPRRVLAEIDQQHIAD